ncbi:single-stranded DNA-binding protein [uncultured Phycicoccus sp.]|uniref:single-stranded DNA-binding protein n=1 Tax=uncultured Phycicoccus sp. TaxID=661422 RepID=UPI002611421F|nr:single-stranded DNA-binding protein [uncultured Phycicoccus sp.]
MYETYTTVQGRLVADPVVKQGRYGDFTTFRVAQSERHPVREEPGRWADSEPSFYDVSVSRGAGENAARSLRKGHPVLVHGRLRVRQFRRDDGSYGTAVELEAYALGHDLRWGSTTYTRNGDLAPALPAGDGGVGDPERDPYVVLDGGMAPESTPGPGRGHADSGPLVPPAEEQVA